MRSLLLLPLALSVAGPALHRQETPAPARTASFPKGPTVYVDDDRGPHVPARIQDLRIAVRIVGSVATTTWDLTLANPQDRVLEGELVFPLGPGQTVSRFALDMGGTLREGVVVDKAKGRQVFEEVVRRGVDPGLLEMTAGNAFRARIYPIPARGTRRLVLATDQELPLEPRGLRYHLPLDLPQAVAHFEMKVEVLEQDQAPVFEASPVPGLAWRTGHRAFVAETQAADVRPGAPLDLLVPRPSDATGVFLETREDGQTFYVAVTPEAPRRAKTLPRNLVVAWDASGSAGARDRAAEVALLEAYLRRIDTCTVRLVVFRNTAEAPVSFEIRGGDSAALRKALEAAPLDGATDFGSLDLAGLPADEVLLFSDGLATLGEGRARLPKAPLVALTSAPTADPIRLQAMAESHGGECLDLAALGQAKALDALVTQPLAFQKATYEPGAVSEVYPNGGAVVRGSFGLAGRLLRPGAELTLHFGYGATEAFTRRVRLDGGTPAPVARLWAQKKLVELRVEPQRHAATIRDLGKTYGLVTPETSLLVLDTAQDYARYEVTPPPELKAEVDRLVQAQVRDQRHQQQEVLEQVRHQFQARIHWWETEFKPGPLPKPSPRPSPIDAAGSVAAGGAGWSAREDLAGSRAREHRSSALGAPPPPSPAAPAAQMARKQEAGDGYLAKRPVPPSERAATIELKTWDSGQPYLRALESVPAAARYGVYLKLKKDYGASPGFYLDCADRFLADGQKALALRILSNLAELKLEDAALLRVLGHRLRQLHQTRLAMEVFEEVARLREEEPQSWRDLALACAEAGRVQRAADLFWKVVSTRWDGRFQDVNLIALGELNALAARAKVSCPAAAQGLLRNLPVDVRVVLNWDTNDSDMDLHVVDPRGEECFYSHPGTGLGGHLSADVTGGYGPEEFLLQTAIPGRYRVKVNYYGTHQQTVIGATTVNVELHLRYATGRQESRSITLRLTGDARMVEAGSFRFGEDPK